MSTPETASHRVSAVEHLKTIFTSVRLDKLCHAPETSRADPGSWDADAGPAARLAVRGWRHEGNAFIGHFRVGGRRWRGQIVAYHAGVYAAYVWNPPLHALAPYPERALFQPLENWPSRRRGCHKVYLLQPSAEYAITHVETILKKALP